MWLLVLFGAVFLIILFVDFLLVDQRALQLTKQFRGLPRLPIIGTAYGVFLINTADLNKSIDDFMRKYASEQVKVAIGWNLSKLDFFVEDPRLIAAMMQSTKFNAKGYQHEIMSESFGDGLLFSRNEKWFARRRIITPTFHFKILVEFFEIFKVKNRSMMAKIERQSSDDERRFIDVIPLVTGSLIETVCETAMGCRFGAENENYVNAVLALLAATTDRMLRLELFVRPIYYLSSTRKVIEKNSTIMRNFTTQVISVRRAEIENQQHNIKADEDDCGAKKRACLLDVLLNSRIDGEPLTTDDILEEVNNFMFAGQDTTTNAISFALAMIAKHPEVQTKVLNEIMAIIGDDELEYSHMSQLKYLDMVIKETLRLFPPVPITTRRIYEELELEGFTFPANANFLIFLFRLLRNPEIFDRPDEFIPERFEHPENIPSFAFIPFSAGGRNCIGQKYAMNLIRVHIVNIVRKYRISLLKTPKVVFNVTTKCDGVLLRFANRKPIEPEN